jgi:hypothetical protein
MVLKLRKAALKCFPRLLDLKFRIDVYVFSYLGNKANRPEFRIQGMRNTFAVLVKQTQML